MFLSAAGPHSDCNMDKRLTTSSVLPLLHPAHGHLTRLRVAIAVVALVICAVAATFVIRYRSAADVRQFGYEIVQEYPHDPRAYCQGLVYENGELFEGTGKYGESELRRVKLETGEVLQAIALDRRYFGEGIAILGNYIYQLTWRERVCFVYDKATLKPTGKTLHYSGEGWGLTTDGKFLIMSDGTSVLRFLDPQTFRVVRQIVVRENGRRVLNINELEYIRGHIVANVWKQNYLIEIEPRSGRVTAKVDLSGLRPFSISLGGEDVLNGIAYDAQHDRLFITGKNWPTLYEIRLVPR